MKRIIFIVIDGLGDMPIPELGNKTPLEAADTPNLDFFAKNGLRGLIESFRFHWQEIPTSDPSHLALFGYAPEKHYLGRGVYEAAGAGVKLKKGDVALRANFAAVDEDLKILDRRAGRIKNTGVLIRAFSGIKVKGVKISVKKSYGHRAVVYLKPASGNELSSNITDGDPKKINERVKKILPKDKTVEAEFTAKSLNEFLAKAHQILKNHILNRERIKRGLLPANYLLVRGAGKFRETAGFKEKYGLKSCFIAGGTLYKGIGRILGMDEIKVSGANGFPDTNLRGKFEAAGKAIKKYDFVFLHIKAADSLAEDGNFLAKKEFIEKIDKNAKGLKNLKNVLIVFTGDHSTCCSLKGHCNEPLPCLIFGLPADLSAEALPARRSFNVGGAKAEARRTKAGDVKDGAEKFSEKDCRKGGFGKIKSMELMPILLRAAGKSAGDR